MLKKIAIGFGVLVAVLLVVTATRPATFHIERSAAFAAPPNAAFAQVNDFHAWQAWSPWDKLDPNMKRSYEGPKQGVGAKYAWAGNDEVGQGRMTITRSDEPSLIELKLEFLKPFETTNKTTFRFEPSAGGTKVTWAMDGENNFMGKAFSLFMDMDSLVGSDFERGLEAMKGRAESAAKDAASVAEARE